MTRRVLITGASSGIGAEVAWLLQADGARVALNGRDEAALVAVAGESAISVPGPLDEPSERDRVVDQALAALGGLDALVLSAGYAAHAPFEVMSEAALRAQLEVNLVAPLLMVQRALPALREARGCVVFLGSTLVERPAPGTLGYTVAKAGLHAATRALAGELAPVRVNAIAPGVVDTPMIRAPRHGEDTDDVATRVEALRELHPLGLGEPADVAGAVRYLLDTRWLTGTVLTLDGGLTA